MTEALGFAKPITPSSPVSDFYGQPWYPRLAEIAFTQVGGTSILLNDNSPLERYWTSTDLNGGGGHAPATTYLSTHNTYYDWNGGAAQHKTTFQYVRAFINY